MILRRYKNGALMLFTVLFGLLLCAGGVFADEVLQNAGFEDYDAVTLVPEHWTVVDGHAQIYTGAAYEGSVSVYCPGGTYVAACEDNILVNPGFEYYD